MLEVDSPTASSLWAAQDSSGPSAAYRWGKLKRQLTEGFAVGFQAGGEELGGLGLYPVGADFGTVV